MNYLKHYCNLIRKAENRVPPEGYTEKHHTFPVSIFGKNKRIVVLTAREHYIAHALLEKICIKKYGLEHYKTQKMTYAHLSMNSGENRYYNSYLYENAKNRHSKNLKNKWNENGRREKLSKNNPSHRPEVKEKQKKSALERWNREGERERMLGKNNHFYGRIHTKETREKIGEKSKERVSGKNNPNSKTWKITFECGKIIIVECLSVWAKENGYKYQSLTNVRHGLCLNHKGIIRIELYEIV